MIIGHYLQLKCIFPKVQYAPSDKRWKFAFFLFFKNSLTSYTIIVCNDILMHRTAMDIWIWAHSIHSTIILCTDYLGFSAKTCPTSPWKVENSQLLVKPKVKDVILFILKLHIKGFLQKGSGIVSKARICSPVTT